MQNFVLSALKRDFDAVLWDLDGVVIDSLELDYRICNPLLQSLHPGAPELPNTLIRKTFPLAPDDFWRQLTSTIGLDLDQQQICDIVEIYEASRKREVYALLPGVEQVLGELAGQGIPAALVSNNKLADLRTILASIGLEQAFGVIIGNDQPGLARKPAPDTYLAAAKELSVPIKKCLVIEDSLIGAQAGKSAGAFVLGVATGATDYDELAQSDQIDMVLTSLQAPRADLRFGDVTDKKIVTPNDFVSHMVEHIAWRLGVSIDFNWPDSNWKELGRFYGKAIADLPSKATSAAALGMIDDGSAECLIQLQEQPGLHFRTVDTIDEELFLSSRCEQLASGQPLVDLLEGLAEGMDARIDLRVCSFEDPHHTWEGIYRSIGIALGRIYRPDSMPAYEIRIAEIPLAEDADDDDSGEMIVRLVGDPDALTIKAVRKTAETSTALTIRPSDDPRANCRFLVANSIEVDEFGDYLGILAKQAGLEIDLGFEACELSSSHVVLEDTGIILGRALALLFYRKMMTTGINGAGSSLQASDDFMNDDVQVGISVEGRKFVKYVGFQDEFNVIRKELMIGHTIGETLRSEDLDDFVDGLAIGLSCSIMVHMRKLTEPREMWIAILGKIGTCLREGLDDNPMRQGVIAGVKATLS